MSARNVLVITVDSLRYDRTVGAGKKGDRVPILSEITDEAISFEQAVANGPNTPSSFPSILTSTYPLMYGGYRYLDERRPFVSDTLKRAGLETVGYHSNPHLGADHNYDQGFKIFNDEGKSGDDSRSIKNLVDEYLDPDGLTYRLLRRAYHFLQMTTDISAYTRAPELIEQATDWFEHGWNGDDPFFMWLHYMDVHYPFQPPERFLRELGIEPLPKRRVAELNGMMQENPEDLSEQDVEDLIELYDGEMRFTDHYIGKVVDELRERDVLDETIVVITADHGEAFGEHGRFGHHPYLYDELLRVPLIVRVPGLEPRTVDQQVSLIDLGPTLYELLDVEIPDEVQGTSFAPLLRGEEMEEKMAIATGKGGETLACRTSEWKCFWLVEEERVELYNLNEDPDELTDVSVDNPEVVAEFKERMRAYLDEADTTDIALPEVETSDQVEQRLRDLGYR